jgi:Tol biopolymer transport system component
MKIKLPLWIYSVILSAMVVLGLTISIVHAGLSADGTKIVFDSNSDLLRECILNNQSEIWLYDTTGMTYTHIISNSGSPSLNADGTKIAFQSSTDFLNQGSPGTSSEIWLYDTTTLTYTRITTASNPDRGSTSPHLSADGTRIIFTSDSDFFNQGIQNDQYEVWLYDTTTLTYTRISTSSGTERNSAAADLSADGAKIVFVSNSDFLNQGIDIKQSEVWLYDTVTTVLTRVTTSTGNSGIRESFGPYLSADGTKITFSSDADFLNEGIEDEQFEIWMYNLETMDLTQITRSLDNPCTLYLPLILK